MSKRRPVEEELRGLSRPVHVLEACYHMSYRSLNSLGRHISKRPAHVIEACHVYRRAY